MYKFPLQMSCFIYTTVTIQRHSISSDIKKINCCILRSLNQDKYFQGIVLVNSLVFNVFKKNTNEEELQWEKKILILTANVMSLLYCEGATISNLSQIIMSPSREQCEWCNHGNTATETREGTERMLPEQICTHIFKKDWNHIKPEKWTTRLR